jgi:hypothetical protein
MFSKHPKIAKEWAEETPNMKRLVEKVSKMKRGKSGKKA